MESMVLQFYSYVTVSLVFWCYKKNDNIITFKFSTKLDACYLKKKKLEFGMCPKMNSRRRFDPLPWPNPITGPASFYLKIGFIKYEKYFQYFKMRLI